MKLKEVLDKSIQFFKDKKFDSPRLDAELLISHALKMERMQLYIKYESPLNENEVVDCREVIRRRSQGEPVAYITGDKGFYGFNFFVGPGVLIPRPETEDLVEMALDFIKSKSIATPRILDLGAGTGCIGFSVLKNCPSATLVSVEKSEVAFKFLQKNAEALQLTSRAELVLQDVNELKSSDHGSFDIILSNPPYISKNDPDVEEAVKKFEPNEALFAAGNGFELLKQWSANWIESLKAPGLMAFEMGYLQGAEMEKHFHLFKKFSSVQVKKDLSGLDRIIKGTQ